MISKLVLKNFQSHKDTRLDFSPGINVIIGPSDSGKTALIRSIKWVTQGRPLGDSIRSTWGGDTEVEITTDDNTIQRIRDSKGARYLLGEEEYAAAGTDVPNEIITELNLNNINLQQQLDRPFLLDESPGAVAGHFNKVAHLDIIDRTQIEIDRRITTTKRKILNAEESEKSFLEQLKQYDYLEGLERKLEILEEWERRMLDGYRQIRAMTELVEKLEPIQRELEEQRKIIAMEPTILHLLDLHKQLNQSNSELDRLRSIVKELESIDSSIGTLHKVAAQSETVDKMLELARKLKKAEEEKSAMERRVLALEQIMKQIEAAKQIQKRLEKEFEEEMPKICPLCGTKLK